MYPFIHIFGKTIGTYGLCMVLAVIIVAVLGFIRGKKRGLGIEDVLIVGCTAVGMALICGGLLYIFVTYPIDVIIAQILDGSFGFLNGGIVFYGGLIGGVLGAFLGVRLAKCKFANIEYALLPWIPLGHAIGRVGCVMAGCCHGRPYDGPFAIYYPHAVSGLSPTQGYFPVQPLESLMNLVICGILLLLSKKLTRRFDLLMTYLGCYGIARVVLEMFRGDAVRGIYFSLSLSQWISIGMLAASAFWFLFLGKRVNKAQ